LISLWPDQSSMTPSFIPFLPNDLKNLSYPSKVVKCVALNTQQRQFLAARSWIRHPTTVIFDLRRGKGVFWCQQKCCLHLSRRQRSNSAVRINLRGTSNPRCRSIEVAKLLILYPSQVMFDCKKNTCV
jgi:hypothetical protein